MGENMDISINPNDLTGDPDAAAGSPAVVAANWYQFRPGQRIPVPRVDAVSLIWILEGSGELRTRTTRHKMTAGMAMRVPWRSAIEYRADASAPFRTGAVHIVPWHSSTAAVTTEVAVEGHELFGSPSRRGIDGEPPLLVGVTNRSETGRRLISIGSFCVERFLGAPIGDDVTRALGVLMLDGLAAWDDSKDDTEVPRGIARMVDFVSRNMDQPLRVQDVARAGGVSVATAQRHFRQWAGESIVVWLRNRRLHEAARLLRTTGMRVNEVAKYVGFSDPLYFSRVFSAAYGTPPSRYAGTLYTRPDASGH
ncbi:AraC family transcriptional regulator [Microbacterium lacus]|uniref:HTH araC/xylS-type domain-containing protein n=1 Tax=Microbacterium lacus TaxID=415217 RepID=A0ABN2FX23_9MICO